MQPINLTPIGIVKNNFDKPTSFNDIKAQASTIIIYDEYAEALTNIDEVKYLDIIFNFHLSSSTKLAHITHFGDYRGVFASRSPFRPNLIGVTSVKLISCEGNRLVVEGLDALNNTPVLDIKSSDASLFLDKNDAEKHHQELLKKRPRMEIEKLIAQNDLETLMIKAAQIHGHYCPGLAMGIMAATFAMRSLKAQSDGMEDLLAIVETNNCMTDGVQFVTGCTFGNNALIFHDYGKTAFTLSHRDGNGIRIAAKPDSQEVIQSQFPDFNFLFNEVVAGQNHEPEKVALYKKAAIDRSFGTLKLPFDDLFKVENVKVDIPQYAPIKNSVYCSVCGESIMEGKELVVDKKIFCVSCSRYMK